MPADEPAPQDGPSYRSPKRSLALSFRLSRDRWKQKATKRLNEIKAFRVQVRDLKASRDLWKQKALHLQGLLQQSQAPAAQQEQAKDKDAELPPAPPPAGAPPAPHEERPAPAPAPQGPLPKKARRARR